MDLPFSVKPDKKISVQDVMTLTRDKCEGTPFDPARGLQGGPFRNPTTCLRFELEATLQRAPVIGVNRAEYITVTQSRGWLPNPIGGIVWLCWGAQDTSCFMPLYAGITGMPRSFEVGDHWDFSRDSARWAFDYVDFHVQVAYAPALEEVKKARAEWEGRETAGIADIDKQAVERYSRSHDEGIGFITGHCLAHADEVVKAWWKLGDDLFVRFNKLGYYDPEKRARDRSRPVYPEWWRKAVRVWDALTEGEK